MKKHNDSNNLRQIPELTRKYAQSRMFPFLISIAVGLFFMVSMWALPILAGKAYRAGNMFWVWICGIGWAGAIITLSVFIKSGGKMIERIARRLYGNEGDVTPPVPERMKKRQWVEWAAPGILLFGVIVTVALGFFDLISLKYMQPISAIYVVPTMVFFVIWGKPGIGLLPLLWPFLYAVHAILVVAGAPIQFSGHLQALDMIIPTAGYGLLCGLIGHIYNRYTLRKLKKLTGTGDGGGNIREETE